MRVGVLALQGAFREHLKAVQTLGHEAREVRTSTDLKKIDALILPGGESTAMGRIIARNDLLEPLKEFAAHKPTLGTCAGAILLAKTIANGDTPYLGVLDITVERNAYGSQLDSFVGRGDVGEIHDFPLVFIRAPLITAVGPAVEVVAAIGRDIVGVRHRNLWALTFHPEMTSDTRLHAWFLQGT